MKSSVVLRNVSLAVAGRAIGTYEDGRPFDGWLPVPDGAEACTVHMAVEETALTTGVVTIRRSNIDGAPGVALLDPLTVGPGSAMTAVFSVVGIAFLVPEITTIEAAEFCRLGFAFTGATK